MKKHIRTTKGMVGGMMVLSATVGLMATPLLQQYAVQSVQRVSAQATDEESTTISAVETAKDSVVSIQNYQNAGYSGQQAGAQNPFDSFNTPGYGEDLEDPSAAQQLAGEGSGVIYKVEGGNAYIATNNHVVDNSDSLKVKLADGKTVDGELVGRDAISDLAVVKISAQDVKGAIKFADSDALKVGSTAIAIGSPLGSKYSNSVTKGIVSGLSRLLAVDTNKDGQADAQATLIQTDAAINPGNSGGALINKSGELIGINSSKFSDSSSGIKIEGMGFAIPSNEVKRIIDQLESKGKVIRPYLGIHPKDVEGISLRSRTEILKLPTDKTDGVAIVGIKKGSAAEQAGLKQYDVITKVGDQDVTNYLDLRSALFHHSVGEKVDIVVLREGKETKVSVTLGEEPERQLSQSNGVPAQADGSEDSPTNGTER